MLEYYKTVNHYGSAEIVIRKSRFIGHARPVTCEEEAVRFIAEIKKKHHDATHNCSAFVSGERDECQKQSDDGEPSGTAGKPILEVIRNQGLKNTAVVVTRYFGGIMLGAGGLIRAYTDGAVAGLEAAEPVYQVLHKEVAVEIDYTWLGKIENGLHARGTLIENTSYTDKVMLHCLPLHAEAADFIAWTTDLTQGQARISTGRPKYIARPSFP